VRVWVPSPQKSDIIQTVCSCQVFFYAGLLPSPPSISAYPSLPPKHLGARGDERRTRQQTYVEKHLTAAKCLASVVGHPQTSTRTPSLDPAVPQTSCFHPDFRAWILLRHWLQMLQIITRKHSESSNLRRGLSCFILGYRNHNSK